MAVSNCIKVISCTCGHTTVEQISRFQDTCT